jgi:hypothetical protein
MSTLPHIPIAKATTTNITVYKWPCTHCGTNNLTLATSIIETKDIPKEKITTCICCGVITILKHHTFVESKTKT